MYINRIIPVILFAVFCACQSDNPLPDHKGELTLFGSVEEMKRTGSRAVGDNFFLTGSEIEVTLTTTNSTGVVSAPAQYTYIYQENRIFTGNPGFYFPLDDTYISSLSARWPAAGVRQEGLKNDQREFDDYKSSDWMTGGTSIEQTAGIVATDAPVPLMFKRENVLLDFELVGQNTTGLDIESLLIELQSTEGSLAFWAYCGNPNGHAELIMPAGSRILSEDNYLIGRLRVAGQANDYTIIFPKTDLTLEAGRRYLITLTPQGYFMNAFVYLSGFAEAEEGIGIPFQQPTPDMDGNFLINTPGQLISLSYLMRHYNDGTTFVWSQRTYVISDALLMTADDATRYLPIPRTLFAGVMQNAAGTPITEVNVTGGGTLPLFDDNN